MTVVVTHTTPADSSFSTTGASAWNANHTLSGVGTMAGQDSNAVAITGGSVDGTTVGATTASTGAFTTLSASSTVSGTGFSTYLASPPAIGGTTPAAGTFTTLIGGGGSANYEQITGGATGKAVQFQSLGSDAAVSLAIQPKGTGAIDLAAGSSGVNISNGGTVTAITRTGGGSLYTSVPSIALSAPTTAGGVQAVASITISLNSIIIASGGTGYTAGDTLTVIGGTGTAIVLTVSTVSSGVITAAAISNFGSYSVAPSNPMTVTGGTGTGATFTPNFGVQTPVTITNAGSGYVEQPTVTFSGGGGSGAAAVAQVGAGVSLRSLGSTMSFAVPSGNVLQLQDNGSAVPNYLTIKAAGTSQLFPNTSNSDLLLSGNGTGGIRFNTNSTAQQQMAVTHTASAVNYVQVTGAATGSGPTISSQGSDANPNVAIFPKGLGIVLMNQQTPTAVTATGTLTIANLLTQIVTSTSATAVSLTLPTGTLSDAGVSGGTSAVNTSFDWAIINLGSAIGDVTLVAGTAHTIVGSVTVTVGTTGNFRSRKTATNTFVTYRV
jgi:hypothetical protein